MKPLYIASVSGGKDSMATVLLAHKHRLPLDLIIFVEVMFDKDISGELPEHIDFIRNYAFPLFESWGYKTLILHSDRTYMDCFYHIRGSGKSEGKKAGFPMSGCCEIQRDCKMRAIRQFYRNLGSNYIQYIGYAADEPERLKRLNDNSISLLAKYGYTEKMAYELCRKNNLLSPLYDISTRGGCFFCPNARDSELGYLRSKHPELWQRLLMLEDEPDKAGYMWNTLKKQSIHDKEHVFMLDDLIRKKEKLTA